MASANARLRAPAHARSRSRTLRAAQASESYDARVEASAELSDAWDALRESCAPLVARFYQARTHHGHKCRNATDASANAKTHSHAEP